MKEREALAFVERDARAIATMGDAIVRIAQRLRERATVEELADPSDPAPSAEYLLGYSAAVLRAGRARAEREYRTTIDDCGDSRQAWHNAMGALWSEPKGADRETEV